MHAHSYNLYCTQGATSGVLLKKKSISGGSFIRGKSVKEELSLFHCLGLLIRGRILVQVTKNHIRICQDGHLDQSEAYDNTGSECSIL